MAVTGTLPGSNGWLFINNSKFFACEAFWNGITLENMSAIYTSNGSQFEDAESISLEPQ